MIKLNNKKDFTFLGNNHTSSWQKKEQDEQDWNCYDFHF